jgi:MtaA/CmuA family methyltransferase
MCDYTLRPAVMADCVAWYWERFRPDAVWLSADTWVTAEAMGARVAFAGDDQPMSGIGEPAVRSASDIARIPPANPSSRGRMPLMLEAMALLRRRLGGDVFIVGCFDQSPFSLACALAGIHEMMLKLHDDRPFVDALLERCVEHATAYANALGAAGADLLSTGDSPAGLVGPERYREAALPAEQRVFEGIRRGCGVPGSLHICGRTSHILGDMARSGARVLEIDHAVDLREACRLVPPEVALWGNLDPVGVLLHGTPERVEAAAAEAVAAVRASGRTRFVLSTGCTLAPATPPANIEALVRAGRS